VNFHPVLQFELGCFKDTLSVTYLAARPIWDDPLIAKKTGLVAKRLRNYKKEKMI